MPNILFTFKIGDKEIDPSKFGEQFKEAAVEGAKDNLRAKIEAVRCPVHDQNAKAVFGETTGGRLDPAIQGCCKDLIEEVKRSLGSQS
jgi:hypothetical protein